MTSTLISNTDSAQKALDDKLSVREKIGYGLGDAGGTVITCLIMNLPDLFLIPIFLGLTPALVGTLFMALRVFDAISDPVMGSLLTAPKVAGAVFAPGSYGLPCLSALSVC